MDGAGVYAISRDGRILRRVLDGDETNAWPDDAGTWSDVPTTPDGRPMFESTAIIDLRYVPLSMFDGGIPPDVLANVVIIWPDGGVSVPDGGVWPGGRVSMPDPTVPVLDGGVVAPDGGTLLIADAGAALLWDAGATPHVAPDRLAKTRQQQPRKPKAPVAPRPDAGTP